MYPVTYAADYVEQHSRLTTFFRYFMAIPLFVVAFFWLVAAYLAVIVAWFALLFTGRYPEGLYDFVAKAVRFVQRSSSYFYLLTDQYPSFGGDDDPAYPVRIGIAPAAESYSRVKTFFRYFLAIPVFIMQYLYGIVAGIVVLLSWVVIVFTGKQPQGLHDLLRMAMSYNTKALAYVLLLTEQYPPITDRVQLEEGSQPAPPHVEGLPG